MADQLKKVRETTQEKLRKEAEVVVEVEKPSALQTAAASHLSKKDEHPLSQNLNEETLDEVLSVQGRMKRRFAARRNRQKLKVARMRASRRAADPARIKKRAQRGARNIIKQRFARGRDVSKMPPQEKARIEGMAKKMAPLVSRLAIRMMPLVRKNELQRIKSGGGGKKQAAKKFKVTKGGSASKYTAKKFKVKAPKKAKKAKAPAKKK